MPGAQRTILIVDDDEGVLSVATAYVSELGYAVLQATNGDDGLRLLEERPEIDLLFTDIVMPGAIDGFELAQRAVQRRPELRVIYMSGFAKDAPPSLGQSRFLAKPWRLQALKRELDRFFA